MLKIDGVTHWSIPVNDLEESLSRPVSGVTTGGSTGGIAHDS